MSYNRRPLTIREIRKVARDTVKALGSLDYDCCLFGSAACSIYGLQRSPNDVDMIVLTQDHPEDIKTALCQLPRYTFYTVQARNPLATYRVLWMTLANGKSCKVDILTPGTLSIPAIPPRRRVTIHPHNEIPLVPLLALLSLKLRGWTDHREDSRDYMRAKVPIDEEDILGMLDIAVEDAGRLGESSERWMPRWFIEETAERVAEWILDFPYTEDSWRELGFGG